LLPGGGFINETVSTGGTTTYTKTASANAALQKALAVSTVSSAALQKALTKVAAADAVLQKLLAQSASADAILLARQLLSANANAYLIAALTRYLRSITDNSDGTWLPSSVGADLFAMVDEETPSDADYIYANSSGTCSLALSAALDPGSTDNHVIRLRVRSSEGSSLTLRIKSGASTLVTRTIAGLSASWTLYELALTAGEAAALAGVSYTGLDVEFSS
jgi:hypothetical protein